MTLDDLPVLPTQAGCYQFYAEDTIIYIGKAINLRNRVRSYFNLNAERKVQKIREQATRLEFITTSSETEALILEANLIKRYKPRFNVLLKDDKYYPFLKLTKEKFPILLFTRKVAKDGAQYFGPYPSAGSVRRVQELIASIFPIRQNSGVPLKKRKRPCLRYHMKRCLAPCIGEADTEEYAEVIAQVQTFLEGRVGDAVAMLEQAMREAAKRQDFELAATYRDRLKAVERLTGYSSNVVAMGADNLDFLGVAQAGDYGMVQLFQMRNGRVVGRDKRFLKNAAESDTGEILERFMAEYYGQAMHIPPLILVPAVALEFETWERFLAERASRKISLRTPQRGEKVELMAMAERNARTGLESELALLEKRGEAPGVKELQRLAELENPPYRIEGFDISNLMGTHTVASIVVFEGGRSRKSEYRKMRIRGLDKPDDFYSMHQAVYRRFTGSLADKMPVPDLLLIDGGKGQLSAARRALREADMDIPMLGLAKRYETIIREQGEGILVPETHPALRLLINIRDEAHRTAVGFNRKQRREAGQRSLLDDIPHIGTRRRDVLLEHFSSLDEIRHADEELLSELVGSQAAQSVKDFFSAKALENQDN